MFFKCKRFAVLSGGGARGIAHLAFLEGLDFVPNGIVGTSSGALAAALFSFFNGDLQRVKDAAFEINELPVLAEIEEHFNKDKNLFNATRHFFTEVKLLKADALFEASELEDKLEDIFGKTLISQMPIRIFPTAIDLNSGNYTVFASGKIVPALMASMAIPLVFPPVKIMDRVFLDGGFLDNAPILFSRKLGADKVYFSDISATYSNKGEDFTGSNILQNLLGIHGSYINSWEKNIVDHYHNFELKGFSWNNFSKSEEIYGIAKRSIAENGYVKNTKRFSRRELQKFSEIKWTTI
ncbi:patatin-like phospholipase family protein [bacterium]|nr:patatin-like phospholipase family protein [bacterium]